MSCFVKALYSRAIALTIVTLGATTPAALNAQPATSPDFFESKIRPLFAANCYGCHTNSAMGGLRLDSAEAIAKGGGKGPAVVPGDPDKSLLIQLVRHTDP